MHSKRCRTPRADKGSMLSALEVTPPDLDGWDCKGSGVKYWQEYDYEKLKTHHI